jgi:uncharacterized protein YbaP (TraB family)
MKRLKTVLAALLFSVTGAQAEPPLCRGTDLLAKLEAENPGAYRDVMAQAAATPNGEALFWKIEKDGVSPSWLLGTAHLTDPRITSLPPPAEAALKSASVVALELKEIRDKQEMAMAALRDARFMVLPPGKNLWDLIPDSDEPAIRDNPNMPPGAVNTVFGYQPWVVAAMLSIPACEYARTQSGLVSLDEQLARQAEAQGSELVGLETVEEQFAVFSGMPEDLQVKYLISVSRSGSRVADYFETLIQLYQKRLITAYVPLSLKLDPGNDGDKAVMTFVEQELTLKRNRLMAKRAAEILGNGNAFIAVGALHLPGGEGLVELIRNAGYKVTPVN